MSTIWRSSLNSVTWDKTKALLDARHPETELVFTGRGAPQELIDEADLVTEMKEVKHYYLQGVMARKGIENYHRYT